jgi:transcription antitermination factor NusG
MLTQETEYRNETQSLGQQACWYAVHTRSHFERRVADELSAKGVENYVATYEEIHQWKDRRKAVQVSLFPGYVFARFADTPERRLPLVQTTGVVRILGHGGAIEAIPEAEIEAVRTLLNARVPYFAHPFLREGMRVRVVRGPLQDLEGMLVRIKNQTRLVLSVTLISQSVAAEVNLRDVAPAPGGRSR